MIADLFLNYMLTTPPPIPDQMQFLHRKVHFHMEFFVFIATPFLSHRNKSAIARQNLFVNSPPLEVVQYRGISYKTIPNSPKNAKYTSFKYTPRCVNITKMLFILYTHNLSEISLSLSDWMFVIGMFVKRVLVSIPHMTMVTH